MSRENPLIGADQPFGKDIIISKYALIFNKVYSSNFTS